MGELRTAVGSLRLLRGWSREELARKAGLDVSSIARIEQGHTSRGRTVEQIRQAFGLGSASWQRLLDLIAGFRNEMESGVSAFASSPTVPLEDLLSALAPRVFAAFTALSLASAAPKAPSVVPGNVGPQRAEALWNRLRPLTPADRLFLVGEAEEFAGRALAERIAKESKRLAPEQPSEAFALAGLAEQIAMRA